MFIKLKKTHEKPVNLEIMTNKFLNLKKCQEKSLNLYYVKNVTKDDQLTGQESLGK